MEITFAYVLIGLCIIAAICGIVSMFYRQNPDKIRKMEENSDKDIDN